MKFYLFILSCYLMLIRAHLMLYQLSEVREILWTVLEKPFYLPCTVHETRVSATFRSPFFLCCPRYLHPLYFSLIWLSFVTYHTIPFFSLQRDEALRSYSHLLFFLFCFLLFNSTDVSRFLSGACQ